MTTVICIKPFVMRDKVYPWYTCMWYYMKWSPIHNTMTNVTTRIAVKISNLPPFEFRWDDSTPQKLRSSLVLDVVLPSLSDGSQLFERAMKYVIGFLLRHFPSLKDQKYSTPGISTRKVHHHTNGCATER